MQHYVLDIEMQVSPGRGGIIREGVFIQKAILPDFNPNTIVLGLNYNYHFLKTLFIFLERGEGREKEGARSIDL